MSPCRWITNPSTLWVIGNVLRKYRRGLRQGSPLPPGGDVAVAKPADDDRETFMPGRRPLRVHWLGYRPEPRRLDDEPPGPADLDRHGRCWFWMGTPHAGEPCGSAWRLSRPSPIWIGGSWLPCSAIADPSAEP